MRQEIKPIGTVAYMTGVPSIPSPFVESWTQMLAYNAEHIEGRIHYMTTTTSFHAQARNQIVDRMKGDWVLMLDSDNRFAPDLLHRMLARMYRHDLDVLVGMYQFKTRPHSPVLFKWNKELGVPSRLIDFWAQEVDEFNYFPVECAGAGCLLIRDRVFVRILEELKSNPFDIIPPLGEDFSFFKRLQQLDIQAVCDPSIHVEHLRWHGVKPWEYDKREFGA